MGRVADYVKTLSPAERHRFADLIAECTERESVIAASAAKAVAALQRLQERQQEFRRGVDELKVLSVELRGAIGRLYLASVPAKGRIS